MTEDFRNVVQAFDREPSVSAVYLYGSRALRLNRESSDYDLAIVFRSERSDLDSLAALQERIEQKLQARVDLVNLARASAPIASRILREGILLFDRQPIRRADVLERAMTRVQDYLPVWERSLEESAAALRIELGDR